MLPRLRGVRADEAELARRVQRCLAERVPLVLEPAAYYAQFAPLTAALEEARARARRRRFEAAAEEVLEHFQARIRPIFFLHHSEPELLRPWFEEHPEEARPLLRQAERVLAHQFSPLGAPAQTFPTAIDWFSDFCGRSWVCAHVEDLRDQRAGRRPAPAVPMGPIEVTWEFNRHGHFVDLGRAYWLTGNERFASEFIVQVVDWTGRNPALEGVNWLDPATIGARCVNWLLALHMFLGSEQLTPEILGRILGALLLHGAVLAHHVRQGGEGLLPAAGALYVLAFSTPEFAASRRWMMLAGPALARGAAQELGRDGLHRTGSVAAHRLACEWLLLPLALHQLNGSAPPAGLLEAAVAALEALQQLRAPNGQVAELGPAASEGFLARACGPSEHTRRLLALGALASQRGDLRHSIGEVPGELLWWYGPTAARRFAALTPVEPPTLRRLFPQVGVMCARDGWGSRASWCLVRATPAAREPRPEGPGEAPGHDDHLSLCLALEGEMVLLEPGCPALPEQGRELFARLSCHSALRLPGEREPLASLPLPEGHPAGRDLAMEDRREGTYMRAVRQVWVGPDTCWPLRREILFQPQKRRLTVRDQLGGEGEMPVEMSLLLAPHLDILLRGDLGCLIRGKRLAARLHPFFPCRFRLRQSRGDQEPFGGWYWAETGRPAATPHLRYYARVQLPATFYVWISWEPEDRTVPRTRDLDRLLDG